MANKPGTYFVVSSYSYEDGGFATAGRGGGRVGTLVLVRRLAMMGVVRAWLLASLAPQWDPLDELSEVISAND